MGFFDRFKKKHEVQERQQTAPVDKEKAAEKGAAKAPSKLKSKKVSEPKKEVSSKADHSLLFYRSSVLVKPVVSEKSTMLSSLGQYVFIVDNKATKSMVQNEIYALYGVHPTSVSVMNYRGKQVRFGRHYGATRAYKKAIVTLPKGKSIDVLKSVSKE